MNNKIKKWLSFVFIFVFLFSFLVSASASSATDYTSVLLSRGYPQMIINTMCDSMKKQIYENGDTFESGVVQLYNEETGETVNYDFSKGNHPIMPFGQIQSNHLTLSWIVSRVGTSTSKRVVFNYDWKTLPVNRWQDPIGASWDSSRYTMRAGSFRKVDKCQYRIGALPTIYTETKSDERNFASGSDSGVTWYADLKGHSTSMPVIGLYGYGEFILDQKGSYSSSYIYGHYVHQKLAGSLSLTIPSYGSFSTSGLPSYDELGSQYTI